MNPKPIDKPKFVFEEVDEVPFVMKGGQYDEYFEALMAHHLTKRGRKRKWVIWKKESTTRVSMPMNWREKFDMRTRTSYDKATGETPLYTAFVRLKDEFTNEEVK